MEVFSGFQHIWIPGFQCTTASVALCSEQLLLEGRLLPHLLERVRGSDVCSHILPVRQVPQQGGAEQADRTVQKHQSGRKATEEPETAEGCAIQSLHACDFQTPGVAPQRVPLRLLGLDLLWYDRYADPPDQACPPSQL